MLPNPTRSPTTRTKYNNRDRIIQSLFNKHITIEGTRYDIKYNAADIIDLLNLLGQHRDIPEDIRFAWGDSILSLAAAKDGVHKIGVRGNQIQRQNKEAIVSSMVVLDIDNNIMNKQWLKNMAPHKSDRGKREFVKKCVNIRKEFNKGNIDILCENKGKQHRESMYYVLLLAL